MTARVCRAATRVNAESKLRKGRCSGKADPTATSGKADTAGRDERRPLPSRCTQGYWRQHVHKRKRTQHGKPQERGQVRNDRINRTPARGEAGRCGVAERFVVPLKPGNSHGGGKGPQFKTDAGRGERERTWRLGNLLTPHDVQKLPMASHAKDGVRSCPRAGCGKSARPVR